MKLKIRIVCFAHNSEDKSGKQRRFADASRRLQTENQLGIIPF
jgi:hypothetical protein